MKKRDAQTPFKHVAQMARAKAMYMNLCEAVEMCENILSGRMQGSKACATMVERTMEKGKRFFNDVKSIRDLAREVTHERDGNERTECTSRSESNMSDQEFPRAGDIPEEF